MATNNDNNNNINNNNRRPWVIKKGIKHYLREIPSSGNNLQEIQKNSTSGNSTYSEKGSLNQVNRTNTPLVSWFASGPSR